MVAAYELLPTTNTVHSAERTGWGPGFVNFKASVYDLGRDFFLAHAVALDTAWLSEFERLGPLVFACLMLLRVGILSFAIVWGFFIVTPLWIIHIVSKDQFLPFALQTGLVLTLLIILEPIPFVGLMKDARSKIFHVLNGTYLLVGWREVCVYLVHGEALGSFVSRKSVRDSIFALACAAVLGCGTLGWSIWTGWLQRLWILYTVSSLIFLQVIYLKFSPEG